MGRREPLCFAWISAAGREEKVGIEHRVQLCLKRLGAQVRRLLKVLVHREPNGKSGGRAARCVEAPRGPSHSSPRAASHLAKVSKGGLVEKVLDHGKLKALKPLGGEEESEGLPPLAGMGQVPPV